MRITTLIAIVISLVVMVGDWLGDSALWRYLSGSAGRPLPVTSRLTWETYEQGYERFLGDWLVVACTAPSAAADSEEVRALLRAAAAFRVRRNFHDNDTLNALLSRSAALLAARCDEPLIVHLHGELLQRLGREGEAKPYLTTAVSQFRERGYPAFFRYLAAVSLKRTYQRLPPEQDIWPQLNEQIRVALAEAAAESAFSNGHQRYYLQTFYDYWGENRRLEERAAFHAALAAVGTIDPWIRHMLDAEQHYSLAWAARGGGWAKAVKDEAMERFHAELALAQTELTAAYALHPEFPEAPTCMIALRMALDGPDTEREWFDRAVAAQFDYLTAYDNLLNALQPRWGGSAEALFAFGVECLDSGRFDTRVPSRFAHAVHLIARDYDDPADYYRRPEVYQLLQQTFENELKSPQLRYRYPADRTHYVLAAWLAGDLEQAARVYGELDGPLDAEIVAYYDLDTRRVLRDIAALSCDLGAVSRLGRAAEESGEYAAALDGYRTVLNDPQQGRARHRFVWEKLCALPFTRDEAYSLQLARQLSDMGLRELILSKYRRALENHGIAKGGLFYAGLARLVGQHNLDFIELTAYRTSLDTAEVQQLRTQLEALPTRPDEQFSAAAIAVDRELAVLRLYLDQDFSNAQREDFKEIFFPRLQQLPDKRLTLDFVVAHLRDGRFAGFKQWNLAANYYAAVAYERNYDYAQRRELLAELAQVADPAQRLTQIATQSALYGGPVLFLHLAEYCDRNDLWREGRNLRQLALDWQQLQAAAMDNTPWVSYQQLATFTMVAGYEAEALDYGELAVDSKFCASAYLLTAHDLIRLGRLDEAARLVVRARNGQVRQNGRYCLPDGVCAQYPDLLGSVLSTLLSRPDLDDASRSLLMSSFGIQPG